MAHQHEREVDQPRRTKAWLRVAEDVRTQAGPAEVYRHVPDAHASSRRVHELAGSIQLDGLAPSRVFLKDDADEDAS